MAEYNYTALDANGQSLSGVMEADSEEVCRKIIAQRGLYCLNVSPVSAASRSINIGSAKIKLKELAVFCRQFSAMLVSGIGIIKSLDVLHSQTENPRFKVIIKRVYESVQRGQSLSSSLNAQEGAFPDLMISMVEAGEASGSLDTVMEKISDHFEKSIKTQNKVRNAMMYPIILSVLTVVVVIILMIFVVPVFIDMFSSSGAELPLPTRVLVAISNALTGYWYVFLGVGILIFIIFMSYIRNPEGRYNWDKLKTTAPKIGSLNVIVLSARFARTLATMMQSGIPLLKSLEITSNVLSNAYFERNVIDMVEDIRKGIAFSTAIKKIDIFPPMLVSMISIGEESGTLDEVLTKTANFYDEESDAAIAKMVGLLEPLMIVIMALIIGFIVVSIILPMYGMMELTG